MKPIDRKQMDRYVDESEMDLVDKENPSKGKKAREGHSVFMLRGLSKRTKAYVQNIAAYARTKEDGSHEVEVRAGDVRYWNIVYGLVGVENYPGWTTRPDPNGLLPGDEKVPTDAFLDTIPDDVFERLSLRIASLSSLSVEDAEKSSPPSTSSSTTPSSPDAESAAPSAETSA